MSADTTPISPSRFASALKDLSISMLHLKVLEIRNSIAHLQYSNDQLRPFAEGSASALPPPPPDPSSSSDAAPSSSTPATATNLPQQQTASTRAVTEPDQDCIEAIRENDQVIERMFERIALVKAEVEERGASWTEFQSKEEVEARQDAAAEAAAAAAAESSNPNASSAAADADGNAATNNRTVAGDGAANGVVRRPEALQDGMSSPWTDGTFQTGTIRNGVMSVDEEAGSRRRQQQVAGGGQGGRLDDEQLRRAMEERMAELGREDDDDAGMHL